MYLLELTVYLKWVHVTVFLDIVICIHLFCNIYFRIRNKALAPGIGLAVAVLLPSFVFSNEGEICPGLEFYWIMEMWSSEKGVLIVVNFLLILSKYFVKIFNKLFNMKYNSKAFLHMNQLGLCTSKNTALRLISQLRVHSDEDLMSLKRVIEVFQFIF